jgi:serine/threonine protein kinase
MVGLYEFKEDAVLVKSNGTQVRVAYMALELINGGELFDFVALRYFDQPICRFFFKQMLSALHFVHAKGASHRDLKPENIMLDSNFNVKIADFGFSAPVEGRTGTGYLHTYLGTKNYMAPEIHALKNYNN